MANNDIVEVFFEIMGPLCKYHVYTFVPLFPYNFSFLVKSSCCNNNVPINACTTKTRYYQHICPTITGVLTWSSKNKLFTAYCYTCIRTIWVLASLGVFRVGTEKINRYAFGTGLAQYFLILQDLFHFWSEISDTYLKEKSSKNEIPSILEINW